MPFEPFTEAWAQQYKEKLNQNMQYRQAARTWEGPIVFMVKKVQSVGWKRTVGFIWICDMENALRRESPQRPIWSRRPL